MTNLHFNLPASQQATLAVYDIQGRLVRTLGERGASRRPRRVAVGRPRSERARRVLGHVFRASDHGRTDERQDVDAGAVI